MHFWWLPTLGFSLWPCAILLIIFVPISVFHERNWKRTSAEYAVYRAAAGATDGTWPPEDSRIVLGIQPWLLVAVASLLAAMTLTGLATLLVWPHKLPGFDYPINYFDRPYLWCMVVAGTAAVVAALTLAFDIMRNPWSRVANRVRRAIYAKPAARTRYFEEALAADPGVPHVGPSASDEGPYSAR